MGTALPQFSERTNKCVICGFEYLLECVLYILLLQVDCATEAFQSPT